MSRLNKNNDMLNIFTKLTLIFYQFAVTVMYFKPLVIILIFAMLSVSCSTINFATEPDFTKRDYSKFNYYLAKNSSKIILLNEEELSVHYANVKGDSLYYCAENDTLSIPLANVEKVVIKNWFGAIAEGFFLGLGTTILSAYIYIRLACDGSDFGAAFAAGSVGLLVGIFTLVLVVIYGGKSEYIFNQLNNNSNENGLSDEVKIRQMENFKKQIEYFEEKAKRDSTYLGTNWLAIFISK